MSRPLRNSDRRQINKKTKVLKINRQNISSSTLFKACHLSFLPLVFYYILFCPLSCILLTIPRLTILHLHFLHIFSFVNLLEQLEMKQLILIQWNGLIRIHTPSFGFIFSPFMSRDILLGIEIPLDSLKMLKFLSLLSVQFQCSRNFLIKEFNSPVRQDNLFQSSLYIKGIKRTLLA